MGGHGPGSIDSGMDRITVDSALFAKKVGPLVGFFTISWDFSLIFH